MSAILNYLYSTTPPPPPPQPTRTDSYNPTLSNPCLNVVKDGYWKNANSTNMWVTLVTPCLTFGRTRQRLIDLDNGEAGLGDSLRKEGIAVCMKCFGTSLFGGWGFYISRERRHIRHRLGIPGSQLQDFAGSCLCPCATVQEHERTVFEYCIENAITTQPTPQLPMTWGDPGNRSSFITIPESFFATPRGTGTGLSSQERRSIVRSDPAVLTGSLSDDNDDNDDSLRDLRIYRLCTSGETSSDEDFLARVKAEALSIVGDAFDNTSSLDVSAIKNGGGSLSDCTRLEYAFVAAAASASPSSYTHTKPTITPPFPAITAAPRRPALRMANRPIARRAYSATFSISTIEEEDSDDTIVAGTPSRNQARDTWPNHNNPLPSSSIPAARYTETPSLRRKARFTEPIVELETAEAVPIRNMQAVVRDNTITHIAHHVPIFREPDLLIQQIEVRQCGRQIQPLQPQRSIHGAVTTHTSIPSHPAVRRPRSPLSRDGELATRRNFFETASRNRAGRSSGVDDLHSRRESSVSNYSIGTKARLQAVRRRWHRRHVRAVSEPRYTFDELREVSTRSSEGGSRKRQRERSTSQMLPCDVPRRKGSVRGYDGASSSVGESSISVLAGTSVTPSDSIADADVEDSFDSSLFDNNSETHSRTPASSLANHIIASAPSHARSVSVPEMGGRRVAQDVEYLKELRVERFLRH